MNYIGIDWGQRKIGISYGEGETGMAFAIATETNDDEFFAKLCTLMKTYEAEQFIVGQSTHSAQNDNHDAIAAFAKRLEAECHFPVIFQEEMFTTHEAKENLKAIGKKNLDLIDDAEAARIILQSYLDQLK